jgi:hypothetical protein
MLSPLRALAYAVLAVAVVLALYFFVQAAMMLYDLYQILEWMEGLSR